MSKKLKFKKIEYENIFCEEFQEFSSNNENYVKDKKLFLMSMILFMRGYSNIVGNSYVYKELCKVMHGYETDYVDIGFMYNSLFGGPKEILSISTKELLYLGLENREIVDNEKYPLLNKSLYHTLSYLFLRLRVEEKLCSLENNKILNEINQEKQRQGDQYTGKTIQQIIDDVFKRNDTSKVKERVFFTSRKTLLNEFNHFEGNMNIFQPAIDITDKALEIEKETILTKLKSLENINSEKLDVIDITNISKKEDLKEHELV